ncbi:MAG: hypothetical protein AB7R87_11495 [Parvibaculaceae bacterium]
MKHCHRQNSSSPSQAYPSLRNWLAYLWIHGVLGSFALLLLAITGEQIILPFPPTVHALLGVITVLLLLLIHAAVTWQLPRRAASLRPVIASGLGLELFCTLSTILLIQVIDLNAGDQHVPGLDRLIGSAPAITGLVTVWVLLSTVHFGRHGLTQARAHAAETTTSIALLTLFNARLGFGLCDALLFDQRELACLVPAGLLLGLAIGLVIHRLTHRSAAATVGAEPAP